MARTTTSDPLGAIGGFVRLLEPLGIAVSVFTQLGVLMVGVLAGALTGALAGLGSPPVAGRGAIEDHSSDALLTAAWLRRVASDRARWAPAGLTRDIARTEGWTFGAL